MRTYGHGTHESHGIHIAAGLAIASILFLLLLQTLAPQLVTVFTPPGAPTPVDLRSPSDAAKPINAVPIDPSYAPRFDIQALEMVVKDLRPRALALQTEARHIASDSLALWNAWRNLFGVQDDESYFDPGGFLRSGVPTPDLTHLSRLQMQLFRLSGRSAAAQRDGDDLVSRLDQEQSRLAGLEGLAAFLQGQGPGKSLVLKEPLADVKTSLTGIARNLNTLDADIRDRQEDYDGVLPAARQHMRERAGGAVSVPSPWHWRYLLTGKPRYAETYDFDSKYREYQRRASQAYERRRP
ncbi:MAG: hypothetical protein HY078_08485 [Elusimicrobia bacterium]|nr:hypothetical protein [Elusimicrobiota bacterium]